MRCRSDEGVLPAGVYWTTIGWYEESLDCPRPGVVLIEGLYRRGPAASRAVRRLRGVAFETGYPWVVHTRYAGIEGDGVAVVLGSFEDEATARRWAAARRLEDTETLDVLEPEAAIERFHTHRGGTRDERVPLVTQVVGPHAVAAYSTRSAARVERGERRPTTCRVRPGRVFVFERELRERPRIGYYAWMPVRCGGRLAWIRRTDTTGGAVFWTETGGERFVSQYTNVECDSPSFSVARIDETWRRFDVQDEAGSCGAP
ncbi:MAG TPA: hypothetical protein RMH99_32250 [Sandaracinaceae bacterium LLY-WYZ-13_1]|nr:hypothetical protein [Sandaracinaceae bacterium LLY-WYZ-13_1]